LTLKINESTNTKVLPRKSFAKFGESKKKVRRVSKKPEEIQ